MPQTASQSHPAGLQANRMMYSGAAATAGVAVLIWQARKAVPQTRVYTACGYGSHPEFPTPRA